MLYVYYFSKLNKWFASPGTESEIGGSSSDEDNKEEHVDDWGDSLWSFNNHAAADVDIGQEASCLEANYSMVRMSCSA